MGSVLSCLARAAAGVGAGLLLAGCPAETPSEPASAPRERVEAPAQDALARKGWLQPTDADAPDMWLASRAAGHDVAPGDPAVRVWRERLADADARFDETDRMIANRIVQLESMLAAIDIREDNALLLAGFTPLAPPGARRGFSDLCQHYYNLRAQGQSREAALASLRRDDVAPASPASSGAPRP